MPTWYRDHAVAVLSLDARTCKPHVNLTDRQPRHQLRVFDRPLDRVHGQVGFADYASAKPFRIGVADADDFELAIERLRDHNAHAARADVQTYDGRVLSCHCLTSSGVRCQVSGVSVRLALEIFH